MQAPITLVGEFRSKNLGDAVIFFVFSSLLKQVYSNKIINLDISEYRNSSSKLASFFRLLQKFIPSIYKKIAYPYMRFYTQFKLPPKSKLCFVGGALFQNYFIESLKAILKTAETKNCDVVFFSIGTGPLSQQNLSYLIHYFQKHQNTNLSIRDGIQIWKDHKIAFILQPDIAICSSLIYKKNKQNNKKVIGIGVISFQEFHQFNPTAKITKESYYAGLCKIISSIINLGFDAELFCNGSENDFKVIQEIKKIIPKVSFSYAKRPKTHYELVQNINHYIFVIASRLHAIIIAYSFQIPFFALGWDPKVSEFLRNVDMKNSGIPLEHINDVNWDFTIKENLQKKINQKNLKKLQEKLIKQVSILGI